MVSSYGTTSMDCGTGTSSYIWGTWNGTVTASTTSSSDYVWRTWTNNTTVATVTNSLTWSSWNTSYHIQELTKEQKAEQERIKSEQQERFRIEQEELRAKEKQKEENARQLLREVLTEEQNKQFDEKGYFELTAVKSGNIYRINRGRSRNVELLDKNKKVLSRLCFHPTEYVHNFDTMVAQKLMLETDEEEVKKVANYS
jgi:hypothetical protein